MVLDIEKIFIAFIGAIIALLLKGGYDWNEERKKRKRLRNLIRTDLKRQLYSLNFMIETITETIQDKTKSYRELIATLNAYSSLNLNTIVFDSNSFLDYHKAYTEKQFNDLVTIYLAIKRDYNQNPSKDLKEALSQVPDFKVTDLKTEQAINEFKELVSENIATWVESLKNTKGYIFDFFLATDKKIY